MKFQKTRFEASHKPVFIQMWHVYTVTSAHRLVGIYNIFTSQETEASSLIYTQGCIDSLTNWINDNLHIVGGLAFGFAVIQVSVYFRLKGLCPGCVFKFILCKMAITRPYSLWKLRFYFGMTKSPPLVQQLHLPNIFSNVKNNK